MEQTTSAIASAEPAPTAEEIIARARALQPMVLERAADTEARRYYGEEIHRAFLDAGLYRMWVPRRYGGYEVDVPTYLRTVAEIARADMSTAWCLCLGAGHAMQIASWFGEDVQRELFGDGGLRCSSVAAPVGLAARDGDAWVLDGTVAYCSGAPYSTHFMGQAFAPADAAGVPGPMMLFVAPRRAWTMLDDWGDMLGLKGSGSHSIRFEDARLPARLVLEDTWMLDVDVTAGTPGSRLHGNPMYASRAQPLFALEFGALYVGAAKGALDEYRDIITTRKTQRPPAVLRASDPDYQRWYGHAMGQIAAAEAMLLQAAEQYMETCRRNIEGEAPFTREADLRLGSVARTVMDMVWETMQGTIFKTAGSSAACDGQRMQRIFRDMATGWSHFFSALTDWRERELARENLGLGAAP